MWKGELGPHPLARLISMTTEAVERGEEGRRGGSSRGPNLRVNGK